MSADGNAAYVTTTNASGFKTPSGAALVDNNASGLDLLGIRLNMIDLADVSDTNSNGAGT